MQLDTKVYHQSTATASEVSPERRFAVCRLDAGDHVQFLPSCYTCLDEDSAQVAAHRACLKPANLNLAGKVCFDHDFQLSMCQAGAFVDAALQSMCAMNLQQRDKCWCHQVCTLLVYSPVIAWA